jgi:hypothetical protein
MLNVMLDVAIGLALVYVLTSILCSGLREALARAMKERGRLLRESLLQLIPDRWVYLRVLNHPMVCGLYRGRPGKGAPPSYIPGRNFANALVDVLLARQPQEGPTDLSLENVRRAVRAARDQDLGIGHALLPVVTQAEDVESALKGIEAWYDSAMERVSGWYKSGTQKMLFLLGLVLAVALNLDSIQITETLARSAELRAAVVAEAVRRTEGATPAADAQEALQALAGSGLPIGYACLGSGGAARTPTITQTGPRGLGNLIEGCTTAAAGLALGDWLLKICGWLITAVAIALGSPFWFDLLSRMVNMRHSGARPKAETSDRYPGPSA